MTLPDQHYSESLRDKIARLERENERLRAMLKEAAFAAGSFGRTFRNAMLPNMARLAFECEVRWQAALNTQDTDNDPS